jgi:hypothetical protein
MYEASKICDIKVAIGRARYLVSSVPQLVAPLCFLASRYLDTFLPVLDRFSSDVPTFPISEFLGTKPVLANGLHVAYE